MKNPIAIVKRKFHSLYLFCFLLFAFAFSIPKTYAQSELTLPFMQNVAQSTAIVPTNTPAYNFMITTSGYFGVSNSQFSYRDLITSNLVYLNRIPSLISKDNYFTTTNSNDIINIRLRTRKLFWSLGVSEENYFRITLPKDLFTLAINGNSSFVNSNTKADLSGLRADFMSYASVNLGLTVPIGSKWSVGGRLRLLNGLANARITKADLSLTTIDPDNYGQAIGTDYRVDIATPGQNIDSLSKGIFNAKPKLFSSLGGGLDLAVAYKVNRYLKFTGSVYNLGYIKWNTDVVNYSGKLSTVNYNGIKISDIRDSLGEFKANGLGDTIGKRFQTQKTNEGYTTYLSPEFFVATTFTLGTKTAISLAFHGQYYQGLRPSATFNIYQPVGRVFDITAGISYTQNSFNNFSAGVMFKPGPVQIYAVTDNALGLVKPSYAKLLNLRIGLGFVFGRGVQKDRDKDGIPDRIDDCPDDKGLKEFQGCPDTDGDGIPNKLDECPTEFGVAAMAGCPDKDGDGIRDLDDRCPDVAGEKKNQGCPDRDRDGVIDLEDQCPDSAGVAYLQGCPDNDLDSITNSLDKCPNLKGSRDHNGCPDSDGDGVYDDADACVTIVGAVDNKGCPYGDRDKDNLNDKEDACPDIAGPVDNKGCPYPDRDGDSVLDKDDACPDTAGLAVNKGCPDLDTDADGVVDRLDDCPKTPGTLANNGCPELKAAEQKVLKTAFDALEFETNKDVIKAKSFPGLLELAKLLVENETYKLRISGHTDNIGNAAKNMTLSKYRALAVKRFLQLKGGVAADKLMAEWFGQTKPVASNKTKAGQAKNRRVEMKVIFE